MCSSRPVRLKNNQIKKPQIVGLDLHTVSSIYRMLLGSRSQTNASHLRLWKWTIAWTRLDDPAWFGGLFLFWTSRNLRCVVPSPLFHTITLELQHVSCVCRYFHTPFWGSFASLGQELVIGVWISAATASRKVIYVSDRLWSGNSCWLNLLMLIDRIECHPLW